MIFLSNIFQLTIRTIVSIYLILLFDWSVELCIAFELVAELDFSWYDSLAADSDGADVELLIGSGNSYLSSCEKKHR